MKSALIEFFVIVSNKFGGDLGKLDFFEIKPEFFIILYDRKRKVLIRLLGVESDKILMFGDTDHDHEVAEALGIDIILFGDGHQHAERLTPTGLRVIHDRKRGK